MQKGRKEWGPRAKKAFNYVCKAKRAKVDGFFPRKPTADESRWDKQVFTRSSIFPPSQSHAEIGLVQEMKRKRN